MTRQRGGAEGRGRTHRTQRFGNSRQAVVSHTCTRHQPRTLYKPPIPACAEDVLFHSRQKGYYICKPPGSC